jgi:hypothetical protein
MDGWSDISYQMGVACYYERGKFYSYLNHYIRYQTFRRYGENSDELIGGGAAQLESGIGKFIFQAPQEGETFPWKLTV